MNIVESSVYLWRDLNSGVKARSSISNGRCWKNRYFSFLFPFLPPLLKLRKLSRVRIARRDYSYPLPAHRKGLPILSILSIVPRLITLYARVCCKRALSRIKCGIVSSAGWKSLSLSLSVSISTIHDNIRVRLTERLNVDIWRHFSALTRALTDFYQQSSKEVPSAAT